MRRRSVACSASRFILSTRRTTSFTCTSRLRQAGLWPPATSSIERFTTTTANPEIADPATAKLIITTAHSLQSNHNGGLVSFGLDGMLYAGFGDGGGGGDPYQTGQDPNALLGSLFRIDISGEIRTRFLRAIRSSVRPNKRGEIWAKGLRNPWRYAFDAPTGLLYIADVGQNTREEVDVVPASQAGVNYGWSVMEGLSCYNATTCTQTGLTLPVIDYATHVSGTCSVTGGYVYRGSAITRFAVTTSTRITARVFCAASGTRTASPWIRRIGACAGQRRILWGWTSPASCMFYRGTAFSGSRRGAERTVS